MLRKWLCAVGLHIWDVEDHSSVCSPIRKGPKIRTCSCGKYQVYNYRTKAWETRKTTAEDWRDN